MIKIKSIIIAATLIPVALNANSLAGNQELAQKCYQLSKELAALRYLETVDFCKYKIHDASTYSEMAGEDLIMDGKSSSAKLKISLAIKALAYSTVLKPQV